jgi:hypothetical protein
MPNRFLQTPRFYPNSPPVFSADSDSANAPSQPAGKSSPARKSSRKRSGSRGLIIVLCTVLTVIGAATLVAIKGNVRGTEFAPSHFQTREFSFYEIPGLSLQITPIRRSNSTSPLATQIRTKGWIHVPRGRQPDAWHLVRLSRGPSTTPAVASLLVDAMDVGLPDDAFWKDWNRDHPGRAAALWPIVQRLAARELYVLIPELMALARSLPGADDRQTLAAAIDDWLIAQYAALVVDLRDADRSALADELLSESLQDYPEAPQLVELKSPSR